MKNSKIGKIDTTELNVPPEKHEYETAKYFAKRGYNIKFIGPHYIEGMKNPDLKMCGKIWETKSPVGTSKRVLENSFRKAIKQSRHIIFDLRRMKAEYEPQYISKIRLQSKSSQVKTLMIITKDGRLLTVKGKFGRI